MKLFLLYQVKCFLLSAELTVSWFKSLLHPRQIILFDSLLEEFFFLTLTPHSKPFLFFLLTRALVLKRKMHSEELDYTCVLFVLSLIGVIFNNKCYRSLKSNHKLLH